MQRIVTFFALPLVIVLTACAGGSSAPSPPTSPAGGAPSGGVSPVASPAPTLSIPLSPVAVPEPARSPAASPSPATANPPAGLPLPSPSVPGVVPTASPVTAAQRVWVGNTDATGVYLRNSPHIGDRAGVLPEGTQLTLLVAAPVEGDGLLWYSVRTPEGAEGYVQVEFTRTIEPTAPPPAQTGEPK